MSSAVTAVRGQERRAFWWTVELLGLVVLAILVVPLVLTVVRAVAGDLLGGDLASVGQALTETKTLTALRNTLVIVVVAGVFAMILGSLFAWLNERTDARLAWIADVLPVVSMFVPALAATIGWVFLADPDAGLANAALRSVLETVGITLDRGPLNIYSWPGLIFAYTIFLTPFAYLAVSTGLRALDPALEEASKVCGARTMRTLLRVVLPSIRPALGSAVLSITAMGFAMFSIPVIIGSRAGVDVLPVLIVQDITHSYPMNIPAALGRGVLLLAFVLLAWVAQRSLVRSKGQAFATIGGKASRPSAVRLGRWRRVCQASMLGYLAVASVIPFLGLLMVALQTYWTPSIDLGSLTTRNFSALLSSSSVGRGMQNSIVYSLVAASVVLLITFLIGQLIEFRRSRFSSLLDGAVKIPAAVTHIIVAISLIVALGGPPFRLSGTTLLLIVAYVVMYLPQASFYVNAGIQQIGRPLLEASDVSGAGPGRRSWRIVAPLSAPAMAAAWSMIFVLMMGDVTGSAMLASSANPVVGFVMLDQWTAGSFPPIAALGVVMTLVSTAVVLIAFRMRARLRT